MKRAVLGVTLLTLLATFVLPVLADDIWVPYVPPEENVRLSCWTQNGSSFVKVSIDFWDNGYNVTDWGEPIPPLGEYISVSAQIWKKIGTTLPFVFTWNHTYDLGDLPTGKHTFTFSSWGESIKDTTFIVGAIIVPDYYLTIQEAINHANYGDTIFVRNGIYVENIVVNKTVSLVGESRYTTIICGNYKGNGVTVTAGNVEISELKVVNGSYLGIALYAGNNTVSDCIITGLYMGGIYSNSSNNKIVGNLIDLCSYGAIELYYSNNNTIVGNTISNRKGGSMSSTTFSAHYSNYSWIYHNNFINDSWYWVDHYVGCYNWWDNGREGNYWSNVLGNDTNGDGILDDWNETGVYGLDYYPLMNPYWIPADVNHDLKVDILDVVRITGCYGTTPSDPDWNPHADITAPYGKIDILDLVTCTSYYGEKYP